VRNTPYVCDDPACIIIIQCSEHFRWHDKDASAVGANTMSDDSLQLGIAVLAGCDRQAWSCDSREHRVVDEHLPFQSRAVTAGTPADASKTCSFRNGLNVGRNCDWCSFDIVLPSDDQFRRRVHAGYENDDQREQAEKTVANPPERAFQFAPDAAGAALLTHLTESAHPFEVSHSTRILLECELMTIIDALSPEPHDELVQYMPSPFPSSGARSMYLPAGVREPPSIALNDPIVSAVYAAFGSPTVVFVGKST
jgi:hypothetical protein